MNLHAFSKNNLKDMEDTADILINDCHALHFSISMIIALLLNNPSAQCPTLETSSSKGLKMGKLDQKNLDELVTTLTTSLCKLNTRMGDFILKKNTEPFIDTLTHVNNPNPSAFSLQRSLNDNLSLLVELKEYRASLSNSCSR
ncbi:MULTISPECIES: hypothetical protein [Pseudomonas]|uniref:hypothetical protein n=1 Tax=Pseudomonas TaxID=286 RepID=UPI00114553E4|nr:hypothetical protein [Pseudomonas poae]